MRSRITIRIPRSRLPLLGQFDPDPATRERRSLDNLSPVTLLRSSAMTSKLSLNHNWVLRSQRPWRPGLVSDLGCVKKGQPQDNSADQTLVNAGLPVNDNRPIPRGMVRDRTRAHACSGPARDGKMGEIRRCRELAQKVGLVSSYVGPHATLNATALEVQQQGEEGRLTPGAARDRLNETWHFAAIKPIFTRHC